MKTPALTALILALTVTSVPAQQLFGFGGGGGLSSLPVELKPIGVCWVGGCSKPGNASWVVNIDNDLQPLTSFSLVIDYGGDVDLTIPILGGAGGMTDDEARDQLCDFLAFAPQIDTTCVGDTTFILDPEHEATIVDVYVLNNSNAIISVIKVAERKFGVVDFDVKDDLDDHPDLEQIFDEPVSGTETFFMAANTATFGSLNTPELFGMADSTVNENFYWALWGGGVGGFNICGGPPVSCFGIPDNKTVVIIPRPGQDLGVGSDDPVIDIAVVTHDGWQN